MWLHISMRHVQSHLAASGLDYLCMGHGRLAENFSSALRQRLSAPTLHHHPLKGLSHTYPAGLCQMRHVVMVERGAPNGRRFKLQTSTQSSVRSLDQIRDVVVKAVVVVVIAVAHEQHTLWI